MTDRLRRSASILVLIALAGSAAACQFLVTKGGRYPEACASFDLSATRCAAMVETQARRSGIDLTSIDHVDLLQPTGDSASLGGSMVARIRFVQQDGTATIDEFWCMGVGSPSDRACSDDARIFVSDGVDEDVPCPGEPPAGCATPPPTPRPAIHAQARPLKIPHLDIPLDRAGHYEIKIGEAGLPDGYLTARTMRLGDDQPTDFWIDRGVRLDVRPVEPDRPPVGSRYREPYDGVEPVDVFLVFDTVDVSPGATLEVRDLEVS